MREALPSLVDRFSYGVFGRLQLSLLLALPLGCTAPEDSCPLQGEDMVDFDEETPFGTPEAVFGPVVGIFQGERVLIEGGQFSTTHEYSLQIILDRDSARLNAFDDSCSGEMTIQANITMPTFIQGDVAESLIIPVSLSKNSDDTDGDIITGVGVNLRPEALAPLLEQGDFGDSVSFNLTYNPETNQLQISIVGKNGNEVNFNGSET